MTPLAAKLTLAVVVIGRNEGERLSRCLASVAEAARAWPAAELIYVDSASTDDSVTRATRAGARVIVLPPGLTTAARGRNAGWTATAADFVLFLDGDTILRCDFVERALPEFADPTVAVVWGHRREISPQASLFNRVLDLDWIYPPGNSEFCGGDALMRRSVLLSAGGYDERLIAGEEPELCRRMRAAGYSIRHIDCPMTGHDLAMTSWRQYWRRAVRAGFAYASVSKRFRDTEFPLWRSDARRNLLRGPAMLVLPVVAVATALGLRSWMPLAAYFLLMLLVTLRTMWRIRWKSPRDRVTCFLYGLHSHVQQIPIFFGQLKFHRQGGDEVGLIEYKGATK